MSGTSDIVKAGYIDKLTNEVKSNMLSGNIDVSLFRGLYNCFASEPQIKEKMNVIAKLSGSDAEISETI